MNVRVLNTNTKELGNVVHRQSEFRKVTRCKVHGGWTLVETTEAVTCATCLRRMGSR